MKTLLRKEFRALTERFFEIQIVLNLKNVIICALVEIPKMASWNLKIYV